MSIENKKLIHTSRRNSSIELLRIISMLMIIMHHFSYHGGFTFEASDTSIPHFWYSFIYMGGKLGVNVFILISGYFLINNKNTFNFKRILKLWGQILFYSVTLFIVFKYIGYGDTSISNFIKSLLPITFGKWWFASTYFLLYLLYPFINKLLLHIDKKTYQKLLIILVVLWFVLPTITTSAYQANELLWFITLYCIAGYIRLYGLNPKFKCSHYFVLFIAFSILTFLLSVSLIVLNKKLSMDITYFYGQNRITQLLMAICLFMAFSKLKIRYNKFINIMASATFGIYLIHDNEFVRPYLWTETFKNSTYQNSIEIIPYSIITTVIVFVVCTLIDLLRQKTIEKPYLFIINRYSDAWLKPVRYIVSSIKSICFGE